MPSSNSRDEAIVAAIILAFREARQRALDTGRTLVEVQGNQLVAFNQHGLVSVLKTLPPNIHVPIGTKRYRKKPA